MTHPFRPRRSNMCNPRIAKMGICVGRMIPGFVGYATQMMPCKRKADSAGAISAFPDSGPVASCLLGGKCTLADTWDR